jgi:hypothetical protein
MKKYFSAALLSTLMALSACTKTNQLTLEQQLTNPLFAERYYDEMVDRMTELEIKKDPLLTDGRRGKYAMDAKEQAMIRGDEATRKRGQGTYGSFVTVNELTQGLALFVDSKLYLSSDFATYPGPSLHLYLTTAIDPRDIAFPDNTSIYLGVLQSPYGVGQYVVPKEAQQGVHRTVVLWDTKLQRLYGFAQLAK